VTPFETIAGFVILSGIGSLGYLGLRTLWKNPRGWVICLALLVVFLLFVTQCLGGPYWTGDEIINFSSALAGLFSKDFDLVSYPHPALFFNVLIFIYSSMFSLISHLSSRPFISTGTHLLVAHHVDLLIIGRMLSLAFWCATCGLVAHIVQKLTKDTFAALIALLVLATLHESYGWQFSPYPMAVFFAYLLLYGTATRKGLSRSWLFAGLLSGLAISSHYLSVWFFVWSFFVFLKDKNSGGLRKVVLLCLIASLVFLLCNFQVFFHYNDYLASFRYRLTEVFRFDPHATYESAHRSSFFLFLDLLLQKDRISFFALLGGLCALLFGVTNRGKEPLHFLLFAIFLLVILSLPTTRFEQYILFLWPSVVLLFAFFVATFRKAFRKIGLLLGLSVVILSWSEVELTDLNLRSLEKSRLSLHDPLDVIRNILSPIHDSGLVVAINTEYITPLSRAVSDDMLLPGFAKRLVSSLFFRFGREVRWGMPKDSKYYLQVEWMPQHILIQVPKGFVLQDFKRDKNLAFILFKRL
jgi:hypothetical protein